MKASSPSLVAGFALRYGVAVLAVAAAAALRWAVSPVLGGAPPSPPYITFYLAIVVAAAVGGFGVGLFATLLGGILGIGMATTEAGPFPLHAAGEQVRFIIYLLSGLAISLIAGGMHRARHQARLEADQLRKVTEELHRVNEDLLESHRSKDRFLTMLAHELRNPLMPIAHGIYILENAGADSEAGPRAKLVIRRQVDQLARLVNDLLDITRITSEKLHLQREQLDLRDVVRRTLEDYRELVATRGIRINEVLPTAPVRVHADGARIAQALSNLLHNAAKFTKDEIRVVLEQDGDEAVLTVGDNGIGLDDSMLQRIFEPFTQEDQGIARKSGGLGLGLTLVKRLVELHGGTVGASSQGKGNGAQVTIRLPLDTSADRPIVPRRESPRHPSRRVLLVEDNIDNATTLQELLTLIGHEVAVCHTGAEALEKARAFNPEVIVCDIGLPDMDGYEVARAFRQDSRYGRTPLIALTGYASREHREKALAAGFDRHLVKPPTVEELERALT